MDSIRTAWEFIFRRFYDERTALIYDFLTGDGKQATDDLPTPEEIAADYPNPCGWGTGMEDSVLNAGSAIDALVGLYAVTGDAAIPPVVHRLFAGMALCATVPAEPGFVARSILPADGKSYYSDTSRDQYTHWVYAGVRLFRSPMCTQEQREIIREVITAIAEKCRREVTPENDHTLRRADGGPSLVGKMWGGVGAHEAMRLPMFYLAAAYVTGDSQWADLYRQYRDEALEQSLPHDCDSGRCYATLQMQYSLRLVYDLDDDPGFRQRLSPLLERLAVYGEQKALADGAALSQPEARDSFGYCYRPWRTPELLYDMGEFGGKPYLNPGQNESIRENRCFYALRGVGECASIAALCPDRKSDSRLPALLEKLAANIDYSRHYGYAPLLIACGHALCLENDL